MKPLRRMSQFGLRTLLVIVFACSVVMAIYIEGGAEREAARAITGHKSLAVYDYRLDASGYVTATSATPLPAFVNALFGETHFVHVEHVELNGEDGADAVKLLTSMPKLRRVLLVGPEFDDRRLSVIASLPSITEVSLVNTSITDSGLAALLKVKKDLRLLNVAGEAIAADGFDSLHDLKQLKCLVLSATAISDADLARLRTLDRLEQLYLSDTDITDLGLMHLETLPRLRLVVLTGTAVSAVGANRLHRSLADCTIIR